jgi:hypothetical protein
MVNALCSFAGQEGRLKRRQFAGWEGWLAPARALAMLPLSIINFESETTLLTSLAL